MNFDNIILGEDAVFSTDCRKTGLNNNVIICGPSGCGKTMSISEPRILEAYHSNLIVTVTKRRLVQKYSPELKRRGYKVMVLDFTDPSGSEAGYDPFQYFNDDRDIRFFADSIVRCDTTEEFDPYWNDSAVALLAAEISVAKEMFAPEDQTFAGVLELNDVLQIMTDAGGESTSTNLDELFADFEKLRKNSYGVKCWKVTANLPFRTRACVNSTLDSRLSSIFDSGLREMMKRGEKVDFEEFVSRKTVLFIVTSPVDMSINRLINVFYGQAFKALFEIAEKKPDGRLPIPVHIICDDFATGGRILGFPEYISIIREKGIAVTLLLQSESQLAGIYGSDDATTIINNCDSYVYMGGMDLRTADSVSVRADIPVADVFSMPVGREYIFRRGMEPIKTTRYNTEGDERYRRITANYDRWVASQNKKQDARGGQKKDNRCPERI